MNSKFKDKTCPDRNKTIIIYGESGKMYMKNENFTSLHNNILPTARKLVEMLKKAKD